jgi:hypothetical protein
MKSICFPDEEISKDDLLFVCYMIERVSRKLHQRNRYTVSRIGRKNLEHCLNVGDVLHAENPEDVEDQWIADYGLEMGSFDVSRVDLSLVERISLCPCYGEGLLSSDPRCDAAGRRLCGWYHPRLFIGYLPHHRRLQCERLLRAVLRDCPSLSEWQILKQRFGMRAKRGTRQHGLAPLMHVLRQLSTLRAEPDIPPSCSSCTAD